MWSAAVEMPTSAAVFSGLAMAASSMSQPPILEPTRIYKSTKSSEIDGETWGKITKKKITRQLLYVEIYGTTITAK